MRLANQIPGTPEALSALQMSLCGVVTFTNEQDLLIGSLTRALGASTAAVASRSFFF